MTGETQIPIALTIAGSDSSGGAGIQADLKTFTALGVYGASVITALTAQNTLGVSAIHAVPESFITAQIDAVADDLRVGATKTGMLNDGAVVRAVADGVKRHKLGALVVDPVMVATSGDVLLREDAVEAVCDLLLPLATVITPNLAEAAYLLGQSLAYDEAQMESQGRALLAFGPKAVLMKGGHGAGADAVDILIKQDGSVLRLSLPRIDTGNTHGTGCTLSAAIAARLAVGDTLEKAVRVAKKFVHAGLVSAVNQRIGAGSGPVDHLHALPKS
ncbi:bifunctional hydroxymethylpyrimidine kinase/phosphomethylpyrimidine kinase [Hyphomicrobium sulfonivorans]|uniref:bifunctional hydroxymethylpyrimidine kinase/phosphomethylpyrimidine kinase n=1 Tax=Hyphomicrobium sulfonivorans TaxID=121290 RepID=UPI0015710DCE|nr:bifunctional hydroxymethylpyrimidine kinase/phosphomethylpyrimidine kinase [Hyphomicrobium sulfonivorans]MBI1650699.1 bifunctional hydroxymethylpyrimidine kinase/phosphomethylpyrimidine kinase [Hyphomicrobium sulfonivorans]NSL71944.1 bifunctional hydroxymethylpyrimidine kinase/phosphomethylpyrimidine kinase [Hyphomicrobium sulfonivorans]